MLAPPARTKRFLDTIQLVLTFASACAVVDASWIPSPPSDRVGYYAGGPPQREVVRDRLAGDLARAERKRREAELREALEQRQLRA